QRLAELIERRPDLPEPRLERRGAGPLRQIAGDGLGEWREAALAIEILVVELAGGEPEGSAQRIRPNAQTDLAQSPFVDLEDPPPGRIHVDLGQRNEDQGTGVH